MAYRCVATSVAGFVQQLAVGYLAHGYYFYVTGHIPVGKDPAHTDAKIIARYGLDVSKWTRVRQKCAGQARVQYLRFDRFFVLIATHGHHLFFEKEEGQIRDVRRQPILFVGYAIGCRRARGGGRYHASVRIERNIHKRITSEFGRLAVRHSVEELCRGLRALHFEPYAPVRDQLRGVVRAINRCRKAAGLEPLSWAALPQRRAQVRPFDTKGTAPTIFG